ncbi:MULTISPECIES: enolase C-terminal domain-like protein [Agrobacterium tumefaciens complex]|jgi:mandelate racemase|uniref:enolase C-terminal domain-like protein n=1 Tax=Agrobacterium tumefaciens TaxID=358 RepID=UPI000FE28726|nr:enolase C-terminal domain-like protein [Agrobacterium tumefaciens]QAA98394.1 mandelate racemase [Agrobacterium tumefaciens]QAB01081.1 mandelate racemase [Agrobacterium tumefaciens]
MALSKIIQIHTRAVEVPLDYPIRTASGIVPTAPLVLIDLETDTGITGRAYIFAYTPVILKALMSLYEDLKPLILGSPLAPQAMDEALRRRFTLLGTAGMLRMVLSGLEMAAWDAFAKTLNLPLVQVLGGSPIGIRAYDSHSMDGESLATERAIASAEAGFKGIKTKIGYADFEEELNVLRSIRKAVGDDFEILVDYNQSLTVPEAIRRGKYLEEIGVAWIEEPVLQGDYSGHAAVAQALSIPVQLGENWFGPEEMMLSVQAKAGDFAMVDIMKIGGVCAWMKASAIAEQHSLPLSSHLFQEISAHLLCVSPTAYRLEHLDIAGPILRERLSIKDGLAFPSEQAGTGVEWDEDRIRQLSE